MMDDGIFSAGEGAAEQPGGYKQSYIFVKYVTKNIILD